MADPKPSPKMVQVNGLGVVEFPHDMADEHVAAHIKKHRDGMYPSQTVGIDKQSPIPVDNSLIAQDNKTSTVPKPPSQPAQKPLSLADVKAQAAKLNPKVSTPQKAQTLPPQPKEALNQYPNPEDRPAKESFEFNKSWAKPGPYLTKLSPDMEAKFQKWMKENPGVVNLKSLNDPQSDYDTRGWWLAGEKGEPEGVRVRNKWDGKIHGNDKFKTPYDGGFSRESMYALPNAPRWVGNKLMTFDGKLVTDETPRK